MTKAYVVVAGETDEALMKSLLLPLVSKDVKLISAEGRSSAMSLATSLLAAKKLPVALVVDSDTLNKSAIAEEKDFLQAMLRRGSSGTRYKVVMAVPTIEKLIIETPEAIHKLNNGKNLKGIEREYAEMNPKAMLEKITGSKWTPQNITLTMGKLSNSVRSRLSQHSLIREIVSFLPKK
ncbi:MAG: hypothetical protein NTX50_24410 [Candidatus Sumerlaeota bacterium]|nr:hypothetical protein [Candidatus Sumerlaeota bacterium]